MTDERTPRASDRLTDPLVEHAWWHSGAVTTADEPSDPTGLPQRVVVDQHGHYWRDYGDFWSMCPVSGENVETHAVAEYRLVRAGSVPKIRIPGARVASASAPPLDVERLRGLFEQQFDDEWPEWMTEAFYKACAAYAAETPEQDR